MMIEVIILVCVLSFTIPASYVVGSTLADWYNSYKRRHKR